MTNEGKLTTAGITVFCGLGCLCAINPFINALMTQIAFATLGIAALVGVLALFIEWRTPAARSRIQWTSIERGHQDEYRHHG